MQYLRRNIINIIVNILVVAAILSFKLYFALNAATFAATLLALTGVIFLFQLKTSLNQYKKDQKLLEACHDYDLDSINKAIQNGASLDCKDNLGRTPLHLIAAMEGARFIEKKGQLLKHLLAKGADPFQLDRNGYAAFHFILLAGLYQFLPFFKDAKINKKDGISIFDYPSTQRITYQHPYTPCSPLMLMLAKDINFDIKMKTVETLLDLKADPNSTGHMTITEPFNRNIITVPIIAIIYFLSQEQDAVKRQSLYNIGKRLFAVGARPLAKIQLFESCGNNRYVKGQFENFFKLVSFQSNDQIDDLMLEFMKIEGNKEEIAIPDEIVQSKNEVVLRKFITEAMKYQNLQEARTIKVLTQHLINANNHEGIQCLLKLIKPKTPGYAYIYETLANHYQECAENAFDQASTTIVDRADEKKQRSIALLDTNEKAQEEVNGFRQMALICCMKGGLSTETSGEALAAKKNLSFLMDKWVNQWELQRTLTGDDKGDCDIFELTSAKLIQSTCLIARAARNPIIALPLPSEIKELPEGSSNFAIR